MTQYSKFSIEQIVTLDIDSQGNVTQRLTDLANTLENTLLNVLYPGIQVAVVNVPKEFLDAYEESVVENRMANLKFKNTQYKLVGASGSSKDGKFYFVDEKHSQSIAERFQHWPQAAIIYFGILVSTCKVVIEEPEARVLVVEDHVLGTNDCRGWISRSLFTKLKAKHDQQILEKEVRRALAKGSTSFSEEREPLTPEELEVFGDVVKPEAERQFLRSHRFYQFRLAFERTQAKGAFKIMEDDAAQLLDADIVLPESSVKPGLKIPISVFSVFGKGRKFRGPVVLGIRELSRNLEFESSYTLVEHAPDDSIQLEILPEALKQVRKLSESMAKGDYRELLDLLGLDTDKHEDEEVRTVEAVIRADASGYIVRFPWVSNQLNKLLARWAYKTCTGGGFRLPAFALADDGYLVVNDGRLFAGSDWIPQTQVIAPLESKRGLCVRYPIRMFEDLLPMEHIGSSELIMRLTGMLDEQGCKQSYQLAEQIAGKQLLIVGTYVMHSEAAKRNGGDFDFDWVCIVEEDRFPRFVQSRFSLTGEFQQEKTKRQKARSPYWNMAHVAMKARGNSIGAITDLKTSCLAAGKTDLAYKLVRELQNALDNLKWNVEPDQQVIAEIREQVDTAKWLKFKNEHRISDLPIHVDVAATDRIGALYNFVRKDIEDLLMGKLPVGEFRGLITGENVTREMFAECRYMNAAYGAVGARVAKRQEELRSNLKQAEADLERLKKDADKKLLKEDKAVKELLKEKKKALRKAGAACHFGEQWAKEEMKAIISWVRVWAAGKTANRLGWLQALHQVVCNGSDKSSGSLLFHCYPQELIEKLAETTGGKSVRVALPVVSGLSIYNDQEGRSYLLEETEHGEKHRFLFQFKDGEFLFAE
jgi:hypothetical protein